MFDLDGGRRLVALTGRGVMTEPDVTIQYRRGWWVLRPETARGVDWLAARAGAESSGWRAGAWWLEWDSQALSVVADLRGDGLAVVGIGGTDPTVQ